jgi:ElaB/YqjD/DUF883 family membrane-anchored ribosome-binding protein
LDDVGDTVSSTIEAARRKANETYGSASRYASSAGRSSYYGYRRARFTTTSFVAENPIMVGVLGVATGLILGALLPGTRKENQFFGRYADDVRDQGMRYARDIAEQGRQIVEENLEHVKAEFKGSAQGQSQGETGGPAPQGSTAPARPAPSPSVGMPPPPVPARSKAAVVFDQLPPIHRRGTRGGCIIFRPSYTV